MLVAITVLCLWCCYSLLWIRQRHAAFRDGVSPRGAFAEDTLTPAPGLLWLFGEGGHTRIVVDTSLISEPERARLRRLFPEAEIREVDFSDPDGGY
ncbi:hypothetical protein I41_21500 [Lacipirellula limnantheis]|uniref:Uncharacterized protein n=1 Tax=Lacipirellula limnantheis TaxID=2528024 RepID=A0A517TX74_9BACT|nr:hypothetical protein I41_21500 [Lacipirellula limnantheis]